MSIEIINTLLRINLRTQKYIQLIVLIFVVIYRGNKKLQQYVGLFLYFNIIYT